MKTNSNVMISLSGEVLNRVDPFGARCVMGALESTGHEFADLLEDRLLDRALILEKIKILNPKTVWVSIQPLAFGALDFVRQLTKITSANIVLGNVGSRAITDEELALLENFVAIVVGQGESAAISLAAFFELVPPQRSKSNLARIHNLRWVDDDRKVVTNQSAPSFLLKPTTPSLLKLEEAIKRDALAKAVHQKRILKR